MQCVIHINFENHQWFSEIHFIITECIIIVIEFLLCFWNLWQLIFLKIDQFKITHCMGLYIYIYIYSTNFWQRNPWQILRITGDSSNFTIHIISHGINKPNKEESAKVFLSQNFTLRIWFFCFCYFYNYVLVFKSISL